MKTVPYMFSVKSAWAARGECRMPLAGAAKSLKTLKTAMGGYWKKLAWIWVWRHVRLGLAPRPFGVGAASVWGGATRRDLDQPMVAAGEMRRVAGSARMSMTMSGLSARISPPKLPDCSMARAVKYDCSYPLFGELASCSL